MAVCDCGIYSLNIAFIIENTVMVTKTSKTFSGLTKNVR